MACNVMHLLLILMRGEVGWEVKDLMVVCNNTIVTN